MMWAGMTCTKDLPRPICTEIPMLVIILFIEETHCLVVTHDNSDPPACPRTSWEFSEDEVRIKFTYSPDLSPTEHLCNDRCFWVLTLGPLNNHQLTEMLWEEWEVIPQSSLLRLIDSMRIRRAACIRVNGSHTPHWSASHLLCSPFPFAGFLCHSSTQGVGCRLTSGLIRLVPNLRPVGLNLSFSDP